MTTRVKSILVGMALLLLGLASSSMAAALVPAWGDTVGPVSAVVGRIDSKEGLAVRAGPSPESEALGYLQVGTKLMGYHEFKQGWMKLKDPFENGWVHVDYLEPRGGTAEVTSVDQPAGCLNIRSGPDSSYPSVGCAALGETLPLTGVWSENNWAELVEPERAWVFAGQIEIAWEPAPSPKTRVTREYAYPEEVVPYYEYGGPSVVYNYIYRYPPLDWDYGYYDYWPYGLYSVYWPLRYRSFYSHYFPRRYHKGHYGYWGKGKGHYGYWGRGKNHYKYWGKKHPKYGFVIGGKRDRHNLGHGRYGKSFSRDHKGYSKYGKRFSRDHKGYSKYGKSFSSRGHKGYSKYRSNSSKHRLYNARGGRDRSFAARSKNVRSGFSRRRGGSSVRSGRRAGVRFSPGRAIARTNIGAIRSNRGGSGARIRAFRGSGGGSAFRSRRSGGSAFRIGRRSGGSAFRGGGRRGSAFSGGGRRGGGFRGGGRGRRGR